MIAAAASATIASRPSWASRLGEGVERKVTRVGDRLDEPGGRGDHRGVVGAELERRLRGVWECGTELGVRRHAADDGNPLRAGRLGGLLRSLDERTDDRALVGGSEVGTSLLGLLRPEVAHRVEQRRLQAGEGEVQPGHAGDRDENASGSPSFASLSICAPPG